MRWRLPLRPNYRGELIPAAAGLLFVLPALLLCSLLALLRPELRQAAAAHAGALAAFAALGWLDDARGTREFGGVRGHLRALLRHRKVTTGLVKLVGGAAAATALGWGIAPRWPEALLNGALIALAANWINLLDLRPGRALKGFALGLLLLAPYAGPLGILPLLAVALPAGAYAPLDLRARAMMGDTGANALGATLGVAAALHLGSSARLALLLVLAGLHLLSEFVSFSAAIERHRLLRWLDRLGRGLPN
ncbi:MAG: hypothetical protein GX774_18560 [Armatimonadetes bacterium]|nr:hypothetical protein [Armatimonadota bacterium]